MSRHCINLHPEAEVSTAVNHVLEDTLSPTSRSTVGEGPWEHAH